MFFVDDIQIPVTWYTIQSGVNDKVYFRVTTISSGAKTDYIVTLPESNYTFTEFATAVNDQVNLTTGLSSRVCTANNVNNTISLTLGALYRTQVFFDDELKAGATSYFRKNLRIVSHEVPFL